MIKDIGNYSYKRPLKGALENLSYSLPQGTDTDIRIGFESFKRFLEINSSGLKRAFYEKMPP